MSAALELPRWLTADLVGAELARRSMEDFVPYMRGPAYLMNWFHRRVCAELDEFLEAVARRESPRLILEAPPRHGKSELASRLFPAHALGRYPDLSIIATSYGSELASQMNRDVQRVIDSDEYRRVFPGTTLWGKNIRSVADGSYLRNSDIFEVVGRRGVYKSSGVGGGVTGMGMHIGVCDDPTKDAEEAYSQTVRDKVWDWFTSTFYTRLMPGGGILVIMTRWHEDDLVGRILAQAKEQGEQWRVVRFPAIAEEDELGPDGAVLRREGEALHPERYSLDYLERVRRTVGERVWNSLYQQRPSAREGAYFKRENWKYVRHPRALEEMAASGELGSYLRGLGVRRVVQRWDTAIGGKKQNDLNACTTLAIADHRYYVLEVFQERMRYPELKRTVQQKHDQWKANKVVVEGGGSASGEATVDDLKRETRLPIVAVPTLKDKEYRADLVSPSQEAGLVYLPEGAPWVARFVENAANFPGVKNDDDVDSFIGAMEEALGGSRTLNITTEFLDRI